MPTHYLDEVFGPGGILANRFPDYEQREGQVALARMVDEAMRDGRHALGEAPCGTGKGFAYGVPAVWHAHHGRTRVVVATANIALQEQLVTKDLPLLAEVLPWPFRFALLKGRNNFLCLDALREAQARGELDRLWDPEQARQTRAIVDWERHTDTGDVSELPFEPDKRLWSKVSVSAGECLGKDCIFQASCYSERARARAFAADIVVTNYHQLFAHLAVRRATGEDLVLPPFGALVLDEAHEAAEVARDFFGFRLSEHTFNRLAGFAEALGNDGLAAALRDVAQDVFDDVADFARSPAYHRRLRSPGFVLTSPLELAARKLAGLGESVGDDWTQAPNDRAKGRTAARLATSAAEHLAEATRLSDPNKVYWIDFDARGRARIEAKPIDVSELLREQLFDVTPSVTLVSATLAAGGTFDFVRRELGVPDDALEQIADSPFDFASQALLVVPDDGLPDPRDEAFPAAVARFVGDVIDLCDGRTLGLFTSYRVLDHVYARVSQNGHRVLRQGEMPRTELARIFKDDVRSVLLGTSSFWTGIDVPGEALTGLVIDKLPFPHPDDPVVSAICERDPQAFHNYLVPRAIITLRQGVGRLIRRQDDIGVVVLLDRRVADKAYGRRFLQSLPPMPSSRRLDSIPLFLAEASHARAC
jgi:ATP-dependent DNA helicase DinG